MKLSTKTFTRNYLASESKQLHLALQKAKTRDPLNLAQVIYEGLTELNYIGTAPYEVIKYLNRTDPTGVYFCLKENVSSDIVIEDAVPAIVNAVEEKRTWRESVKELAGGVLWEIKTRWRRHDLPDFMLGAFFICFLGSVGLLILLGTVALGIGMIIELIGG